MSKFHINNHGVPASCRVEKENCSLGDDEEHFDTVEETKEYADKKECLS